MAFRKAVTGKFAAAGVSIGGERPWDVKIRRERFFPRVFLRGSLGLGESFMDGDWECDAIDEMVCRLFLAEREGLLRQRNDPLRALRSSIFNLQKKAGRLILAGAITI